MTAACENGTFGESCAQICTCLNEGACDSVNGSCTCTGDYEGISCSQGAFRLYTIMRPCMVTENVF